VRVERWLDVDHRNQEFVHHSQYLGVLSLSGPEPVPVDRRRTPFATAFAFPPNVDRIADMGIQRGSWDWSFAMALTRK